MVRLELRTPHFQNKCSGYSAKKLKSENEERIQHFSDGVFDQVIFILHLIRLDFSSEKYVHASIL